MWDYLLKGWLCRVVLRVVYGYVGLLILDLCRIVQDCVWLCGLMCRVLYGYVIQCSSV